MGSGTDSFTINSHKQFNSSRLKNDVLSNKVEDSTLPEVNSVESFINKSSDNSPNITENNLESKNLDTGSNIVTELTEYRTKNLNRIVLATLNINSIRNKFSSLSEIVSDNIDVLIVQET